MVNFSFIRGDTFLFKFKILDKSKNSIEKSDISTLILTCRKQKNDLIMFTKNIDDFTVDDNGYFHGEFKPEDTQELESGEYYFDIEVTLTSGKRKTKLYTFILEKDATKHKKEGA